MELRLVVKKIDGENVILENQSDRKNYVIPAVLLPIVEVDDVVSLFSMVVKGNYFYKTDKDS